MGSQGALAELLTRVSYRPGWKFQLSEIEGVPKLVVLTLGFDARNPHSAEWNYVTAHFFDVPDVPEMDWLHWLLDTILKVEMHEAKEFFAIDDEHIFAPEHPTPEENPNKTYRLPTTVEEFRDL